jgi:hypothetical protein
MIEVALFKKAASNEHISFGKIKKLKNDVKFQEFVLII